MLHTNPFLYLWHKPGTDTLVATNLDTKRDYLIQNDVVLTILSLSLKQIPHATLVNRIAKLYPGFNSKSINECIKTLTDQELLYNKTRADSNALQKVKSLWTDNG